MRQRTEQRTVPKSVAKICNPELEAKQSANNIRIICTAIKINDTNQ